MKLIDLFNKIVNGEELPNKIKIRNDILVRNKEYYLPSLQDYYNLENEEAATWRIWYYDLTDEVEIIEEDKKIEHYYFSVFQDERLGGRQVVESLESKINEIIDKINRMEDKQ